MRAAPRFAALSLLLLALACTEEAGVPGGGGPTDAAGGGGDGGGGGGGGDAGGGGGGDAGGGCVPLGCASAGKNCGPIADGCGGLVDCGACTVFGESCGGGGTPNVCGGTSSPCVPRTCEQAGANCGPLADGCGDLLECGPCTNPGESCGGGGVYNVCGAPPEAPTSCPALIGCADVGATCGLIGNGCGGTADCGTCANAGEVCGGGGVPNQCGGASCVPLTCAGVDPLHCGPVSDGCGGVLTGCGAGACVAPETCGGAGVHDRCGSGGPPCVPLDPVVACNGLCGRISDGCGQTLDCGGCTAPETCGGGGAGNVCGAPACVPRTCADLGADCGPVSDGCGHVIDCGLCAQPGEICGGLGVPNACGAPVCVPLGCADQNVTCGQAGDGCGNTLACGGCSNGESCGGGGVPSQCGRPPCTADTCQSAGATCGPIGDGCGGIIPSCGTCNGGNICGGGGTPSVCGGAVTGGGTGCTGLCQQQVYCPNNGATTVTGVVYAPNGITPIYNAIVYVPLDPAAPLPALTEGASCDRCTGEDLGVPLVSALSASDGTFTLRHVPANVTFPLVIKVGKWRRVVNISPRSPCTTSALTPDQTRLPRNTTEGHIPRIAISTGAVDGLECVLYKAGVESSMFTRPTGPGRIHLYRASIDYVTGSTGGAWPDEASVRCQQCGTAGDATATTCRTTYCGGPAPAARQAVLDSIHSRRLYESQATLDGYDIVIFGCEGVEGTRAAADRGRLLDHVNVGGRLFLSHFNYDWIYKSGTTGYTTPPLGSTATWNNGVGQGLLTNPTSAFVDSSFPRGQAFLEWLNVTGSAHPTLGSGFIEIREPRRYVGSTTALGRRWVYTEQPTQPETSIQQFTFNTPVGAADADICGRVAYSAFHVSIGLTWNQTFPNHCFGALTAQEKTLLFMLFDLASCVAPDNSEPTEPPSCEPLTCATQSATCGQLADGCGQILECGVCPEGHACVQNQCVPDGCTPTTCAARGANCGSIADGCGNLVDCGPCPAGQSCGAVLPNQCGVEPCVPRTCESIGAECGFIGDGCGNLVDCGVCTAPGQVCGGSGAPNICGRGACTPRTCADVGAQCGYIGDGCGGAVDCGPCVDGVCGAGGVPNQCAPACVPQRCADVGAQCGYIGDGCGAAVDCGPCTQPGQSCGAGGVPNQCGGGCRPQTCQEVGAECGFIGDGCGSALSCGPCPPGQICGGGGVPNHCGAGATCAPLTCSALSASCGLVGDGCGNVVDCGPCPDGTTCGGAGVPNQCGSTCTPLTCDDYGAQCGRVGDGCGLVLDCGVCANGQICGIPTANRCGGV